MRVPLAMLFAASLSACNPGSDKDAAEAKVAAVHQAFGAGRFAQVYDASGPDMKDAISRDNFVKMFGDIYARTGPYQSGKTTGWKVNYGTGGNYVVVNHDAQFRNAHGTEEFVFRMKDHEAVLAGYHVKTDLPEVQ
jgi:hypothetical protein